MSMGTFDAEKLQQMQEKEKEYWQEKMKIKPKLLVPPDEAFAPMEDIWENYI